MAQYLKDPAAVIDHAIDWGGYPGGQTIAASDWHVVPQETDGVAVVASAFDASRASVRIGGGIAGHVYAVTNRVTLSDGQVNERSTGFRVEER